MKLLHCFIVMWLYATTVFSQVDVGATALINPTTPYCGASNQTVIVTITNYAASTINFTINNVTVNVSVTGASIQTFNSPVINTGSLAPGASMNVNVTSSCDLSAIGTHVINATTVNYSDVNVLNNAMPTVNVLVNDLPTTANAGPDQSYCAPNGLLNGNTPVTGTGTWTLVSGSGTITSPNSPTSSITGLGIGPNVFRWTISNAPCPDSFDDVTITGDALPTISFTSAAGTDAQTVCEHISISPITYAIGGSATGATVAGLPTGVSGSFSGGTFTISGTPATAGTYSYTVTTTGSSCAAVNASGTLTVNPDATVSLTSATGTDAQSVCVNTSIATINYLIGGGGTGATVSGLPAGVSGNYSAGTITIGGTPTIAGLYSYIVTTTGSCAQTLASGSIVVDPDATLSLLSASGDQTTCANVAISPIQFAIGGGGNGATVSGLPAGITGSYSGGIFTLSGASSTPGTYSYTISTTGSCNQTSISGTLTINPDATLALTSAAGTDAQTICTNTAISSIHYTIGGGATNATASGLPAGVTSSFAGGTLTISGTPTLSGTFTYTIATSGTCAQTTLTGTITVNQDATLTLSSAIGSDNQSLCQANTLGGITYIAGGGSTGATISGLPTGVNGSYNFGLIQITGAPSTPGTYNYIVSTTGNCAQTSATGTITVNPDATIVLSSAPLTDNQTTCLSTPVSNIVYTIGGGGNGATVSGLPSGINGTYAAGTFTISGSASVSGTYNYIVNTTGTCAQTSIGGTILVQSDDIVSLSSAIGTDDQNLCLGASISSIAYTAGGGATGISVSGLPAGVSGNFASGVLTISGTPSSAGSFTYTVVTSGSCASATAGGSIQVNGGPILSLSSAAGTDAQTICTNSALTDITYSIGGSASGATASGLPTGVTASYNSGILTISGTPAISGTFNYTVTTIGGSCPATSLSGTIVSNTQSLSLQSPAFTNDQFICYGASPDAIVYQTGGSASGATVSGLPAGMNGSFSNNTLTITGTPTQSGTFFYTVNTIGSCSGVSAIGNIHIQEQLVGNTIGSSFHVCEQSDYSISGGNVLGGNGTYTYLWESGQSAAGPFTAAYGVNDGSNYSAGPASINAPVIYYRRTVHSAGCTNVSSVISITTDTAAVAVAGGVSTVCVGDTGIVYGSMSSGGIFHWVHDGNGLIVGPDTYTPAYIPDLTDAGHLVTLTMTVFSNNACAPMDATATFGFQVNPLPAATAGGTSTICPNGGSATVLGATASNGSVQWSHNGTGTLSNATSLFPIYTAAIGDAGDTVLLELVVTGNAVCSNTTSDTAWYTIFVSPSGSVYLDAGEDQAISAGESVSLHATGPAVVQWNWYPSIGLSDSILPVITASPDTSTTYYLTGTDFNGCVSTDSIRITVNYDMDLIIANIVTPNNDSKNDTWIIQHIEHYPNTSVIIVNREGQVVYESDDYDNSWDGTYNGKPLPDSAYYYILSFADSTIKYKGAVTILRN